MEREKERDKNLHVNSVNSAQPSSQSTQSKNDKQSSPASSKGGETSSAVPFSTLINRPKVSNEELEKCRKDGIIFDLPLDQKPPQVEVPELENFDIESERQKAESCPYWTDKSAFIEQFNLSHMDQSVRLRIEDLLWEWKHVFYNQDTPAQFKEGIKMKPVKIERIPGLTPRKEKYRRISDKKMAELKKHIDALTAQGVITEMDDASATHASPIHIVLEERWVASKGTTVKKSRFTIDLRALNAVLPDANFPLPDMTAFREDCARRGFSTFSNFDLADFFFQIPLDEKTAKENFGFIAFNRLYVLLRLAMGCSQSPSIASFVSHQIMKTHPHGKAFLDDATIFSKNIEEQITKDLPLFFALCSHYNALLKPSKSDLLKSSCRILGHQIAEEQLTLSSEKVEKLKNLTFPESKKELISRLALLQWFNRLAPKLSELTSSLRQLALPHVRFVPTQQHRQAYKQAIDHLLDSRVNSIRLPSNDPKDTTVLFSDASSHSISCLLTQYMLPIGATSGQRHLHIVGVFSSVIKPAWANWPIWLLELTAFYEATRKFSYFLSNKTFYLVTDSSTLTHWISLENVPKDLSRKIIALQKFQFKVIFLESRLNPADALTRVQQDKEPVAEYPRFLKNRIFNSKNEQIPWQTIFSQRKCDQAKAFFLRNRNQQLSQASDSPAVDDGEDDDDVDEDILFAPDSVIKTEVGVTEARKNSNEPRALSHRKTGPQICCISTGSVERNEEGQRCNVSAALIGPGVSATIEKRKDAIGQNFSGSPHYASSIEKKEILAVEAEEAEDVYASIAAVELDDEEIAAGLNEDEEERIERDASFDLVALPHFDDDQLHHVQNLQKDEIIGKIIKYLTAEIQLPSKHEALSLPAPIKNFLRHRSLFKVSAQKILFRLWTNENSITPLIVVGPSEFEKILQKSHSFNAEGGGGGELAHVGQRKTMNYLSRIYYAFGMRSAINKYISDCPTCRLNHYPKTVPESHGLMLATEPNVAYVIDCAGPLAGWASSSTPSASGTGNPRYIFVAVDMFSRFLITSVMKDVKDDSIVKAIQHMRLMLNGLPRRIQCDNALLTKNSNALKFLRENNVDVTHGRAYISRDQSQAERVIQTLTRLYCSYHTDAPQVPFEKLVAEATLTYNNSPHDSLPNKMTPKDLHFLRATSGFARVEADAPEVKGAKNVKELFASARAAGRASLRKAVLTYLRRKPEESATRAPRIRAGDFCLQKRTSFPQHAPRKLAHKLAVDGYEVKARVATNSFRVESIIDGTTSIKPGDHLIRLRGYDREKLKRLVEAMAMAQERTAAPRGRYKLRRKADFVGDNIPWSDKTIIGFTQHFCEFPTVKVNHHPFCLEGSFFEKL